MSVSPRDLLREARRIAKEAVDEAARRSAINKAYYAAFHGANSYHASLSFPGQSLERAGEHENLINQLRYPDAKLGESTATQSKLVGGLLLRLRPIRVRADYEITADIDAAEMNDALDLAARILNICDPKPKTVVPEP